MASREGSADIELRYPESESRRRFPGPSSGRFSGRASPLVIIILLGLVCGASLAGWKLSRPKYYAVAYLEIKSSRQSLLASPTEESDPRNEGRLRLEAARLKSVAVLEAALDRLPAQRFSLLPAESSERLGWLRQALEVDIPAEGDVLQVRLRSSDSQARDAVAIVNTVLAEYFSIESRERDMTTTRAYDSLGDELQRLQVELERLRKVMEELKAEPNSSTIEMAFTRDEIDATRDVFLRVKRRRIMIRIDRANPCTSPTLKATARAIAE